MSKTFDLLPVNLSLFDGGEGAAQTAAQADEAKGEAQADSGSTRRGKTGEVVLYGRQADAPETGGDKGEPPDAGEGEKKGVTVTSDTLEDRRKRFRELVNGEFKDVYTEDTRRLIDRRYRDHKTLRQQVDAAQPVLDMLFSRYGIQGGDTARLMAAVENDTAYWSEAAEQAGMSVEQYKAVQRLQRENDALRLIQQRQAGEAAAQKQMAAWEEQSGETKAVYPGFDMQAECQNPQFLAMLRAGIPVRHAYEVLHMDDIKAGAAQAAAKQTEKAVTDNIRAKGARPAENGTSAQSGFVVKDDVSKLTGADLDEIARRAKRGEVIRF